VSACCNELSAAVIDGPCEYCAYIGCDRAMCGCACHDSDDYATDASRGDWWHLTHRISSSRDFSLKKRLGRV
jgi:hypothetical protein